MNVNPFSYLMNKISQKVSKSGDTMSGNLEINNTSDGASDLKLGKANTSTGRFFIFASQDSYRARLQRGTLTADRNFTFPDASGTLALKSDIRHWSSSDWVMQNSSYTFTDPQLTQGSFLVSINGYDVYAEGLVLAQRFNNGQTNIAELNSAPHFSVSFNSDNQLTVSTILAQGVVEVQKL